MEPDRDGWGGSWEARFGYVSGWVLRVIGMPRPIRELLKWPVLVIALLVRFFLLEPLWLLKRLATRPPSEAWSGVDLATRGIWIRAVVIAVFVVGVYMFGLGWVGGVIAFLALLALWWLVEVVLIVRARR